jgi:class 3 adenylate cyclase
MNNIFNYFIALIFYILFDDIFILNYNKSKNLINHNNIQEYQLIEEKNTIDIIHNFILTIYSLFLIISLMKKNKNIQIIYLSLILIKYSSIFYFYEEIDNTLYDFRRSMMWLFATPSMLSLYTNINKISFNSIKIKYHIIPNLLLVPFTFFKNNIFYDIFFYISCISQSYFVYNLFNFKHLKYTNIYIFFWLLFGTIGICDFFNLFKISTTNILYSISDLMVKLTCMIVIYDNEEQKLEISNYIDLQSITLLNNIYITLQNFKNENQLSDNCEKILKYISNSLNDIHINDKKDLIKIELLKKILPNDLDEKYFEKNINKYNKHDNVVILFTDIVSYTDFSCKNNEENVYNLLNEMYIRFDIILRKYKFLTKIETIGDSYMVVGNILNKNDISECIYNIIILGFEFIDSLKYLKIYNNLTREVRIGVHCGPIVSGILGLDIPRFCIIGNTVNYTSRLQTTSEPNKIQISDEIYEYIKDNSLFTFQKRENIYLKNIGTKTTYFVNIESKSKSSSLDIDNEDINNKNNFDNKNYIKQD